MSNSCVRLKPTVLVNWIVHDELNFLVKNNSRFGTHKFVVKSILLQRSSRMKGEHLQLYKTLTLSYQVQLYSLIDLSE